MPPSSAHTTSTRPAFSGRFIRPSQTSSSPFTRTPFSSTAPGYRRDDIEPEDSSDGYDQPFDTHFEAGQTEKQRTNGDAIDFEDREDADETDNRQNSGLISNAGAFNSTNLSQIESPHNHQQPAVKRRKTTHFVSQTVGDDEERNLPSSSPSPPPSSPLASTYKDNDPDIDVQIPRSSPEIPPIDRDLRHNHRIFTNVQDSTASSPPSSPQSPLHHLRTPTKLSHFSRFRPPATDQSSATIPLPSFQSRLLSSSTGIAGYVHPRIDSVLPDAFSPSRKRGAREYIHGGFAETVRGWVLDIATRASSATMMTSSGTGQGETERVVQVVLREPSGRFAVVKTVASDSAEAIEADNESKHSVEQASEQRTWMLINTDSHVPSRPRFGSGPGGRPSSKLDLLEIGAEIVIKGGENMRWSLDIDMGNDLDETTDEAVPEKEKDNCHVAVLWDVVR